jgi:hypothetical protein
MDFNTSSLGNRWTQEDLKRQGLELRDGMRCVFYDYDGEDGQSGFLHGVGVVWWDEKSSQFRIRTGPDDLRFTPGDDLTALDSEYP